MTKTLLMCVTLFAASAALAQKDATGPVAAALAEGDFEKTVKLADKELKNKQSPSMASKLHLLRGQALTVLQQEAKAKDAFRSALQQDANAALNPDNTPPDQLELFESIRKDVRGTVSVTSNDPAAEVRIDGKNFGPAPVKIELQVGRHEVEVRAGTRSQSETVTVAYKQVKEVNLKLPAEPVAKVTPPPDTVVAAKDPVVGSKTDDSPPPFVDPGVSAEPKVESGGGGKGGSIALLGIGAVLMGASGYGTYYALGQKKEFDRQQAPATIPTVTRKEAEFAEVLFPSSIGGGALGLGLVVAGVIGLASGGSGSDDGSGAGFAFVPVDGGGHVMIQGRFP